VVFNNAINPDFRRMKFDPMDIKPVLNPVDFLVFKGMNKSEEITDLVFLSKKLENPMINRLREQVKTSIENNSYEWLVARIDDEGKIEFE
jgi:predicted Holliday junction resolvase-like endonuclease